MLGSAARVLPGQARYEVVLAERAAGCRLVDQAAKVNATPDATANASLPLFDDGELQMWLTWTTTADSRPFGNGTGAAAVVQGLLDVTIMPVRLACPHYPACPACPAWAPSAPLRAAMALPSGRGERCDTTLQLPHHPADSAGHVQLWKHYQGRRRLHRLLDW